MNTPLWVEEVASMERVRDELACSVGDELLATEMMARVAWVRSRRPSGHQRHWPITSGKGNIEVVAVVVADFLSTKRSF